MTELRRRMLEDLQLRGLAPKTQQCYVDAVKQLAQHDRRSPDQISDEELRQYFLFLLNGKKVAERTFRIHLDGIKFVSETTLQRPWPVCALVRPRNSQTRPVVLSPPEVRTLLALVEHPTAQLCLRMIDAWGLRLTEGTHLSVSDIAPARMLLRVRHGTGGKDRLGPLAQRPLELLRAYGHRERPKSGLFPARTRPAPLPTGTLQKTLKAVVRQSGMAKDASIHTRRHSSATPLLERGVSRRVIQEMLGHKSPSTTARSTHLTPKAFDAVHAALNALLTDL